jgi:hypothetical protein
MVKMATPRLTGSAARCTNNCYNGNSKQMRYPGQIVQWMAVMTAVVLMNLVDSHGSGRSSLFAHGFYLATPKLVDDVHHEVPCSKSVELMPQCSPSHCGRHVTDGLFPEEDIMRLHAIARKGLSLRDSVGGPSIIDINTG